MGVRMVDTETFIQLLKNDDTESLYQIYKSEDWYKTINPIDVPDGIKDINNSNILYFTGWMYENINIDLNIAMHYYKLSAKSDNSMALNAIGELYMNSDYYENDNTKGEEYYLLSAKKGNCIAQFNLGYIHYSKKKYKTSYILLKSSADQDFGKAQYYLGKIYYYGNDIMQDNLTAYKYFKLASKHNIAKAYYHMSNIFYYGWGMDIDNTKALKYIINSLLLTENNDDEKEDEKEDDEEDDNQKDEDKFLKLWKDMGETEIFLKNILTVLEDNKKLRAENTELKYRPGNPGYEDARESFRTLSQNSV